MAHAVSNTGTEKITLIDGLKKLFNICERKASVEDGSRTLNFILRAAAREDIALTQIVGSIERLHAIQESHRKTYHDSIAQQFDVNDLSDALYAVLKDEIPSLQERTQLSSNEAQQESIEIAEVAA